MQPMEFPVYSDYAEDEYEDFPQIYAESGDYANDESDSLSTLPFWEMCQVCVRPVAYSSVSDVGPVLVCSLAAMLVRVLSSSKQLASKSLITENLVKASFERRNMMIHICDAAFGVVAICYIFGSDCKVLLALGLSAFVLSALLGSEDDKKYQGFIMAALLISYVIVYELVVGAPAVVHKIRGAQMIMLMKVISVILSDRPSALTFFEFSGYVLSPGSVVFGPWISFLQYQESLQVPSCLGVKSILQWTYRCVKPLCLSLICLTISTCFIGWVFPVGTNPWLGAYQTAAAFRFSHYFISQFSEATLTGSGARDVPVSNILKVEMPRSLVEVVEFWNIPTKIWLKRFVFLKFRREFGVLSALIATYTASSVLHGLNFQLFAVLLSLALFTFVEHRLRHRLAEVFDACIASRPCKQCSHGNGSTQPYVLLTNVLFGVYNVFQLAYLGVMFDSSDQQETGYGYRHTLSKWSHLNYAGHYFAGALFVIQYLLQ